jgi:hypothetical protein
MKKKRKFQTSWTAAEIQVLKECYPIGGSPSVMAKFAELGLRPRTRASISGTAHHHGLKSGLVGKVNRGCFVKGQTPPNKGMVMSDELRAKVQHTWFQKGSEPVNTSLYDYAVNLRVSWKGWKYWVVRIAKCKWVHLHVWCYCMANGDMPPKHLVRMNSADDFDALVSSLGFPERAPKQEPEGHWAKLLKLVEAAAPILECITLAENQRRNSGSLNLTDGFIIHAMTHKNPEIKELLRDAPEIINLKRQIYQHKRQIKSLENGQ